MLRRTLEHETQEREGRWTQLLNDKFPYLYSFPNIVRIVNSR